MRKDPGVSIGHDENGTHRRTMQCVFAQKAFREMVMHVVGQIFASEIDKVLLICRHGVHRSDTAARCVAELLNLRVNAVGTRFFNAMHFASSETHGMKGLKNMLTNMAVLCIILSCIVVFRLHPTIVYRGLAFVVCRLSPIRAKFGACEVLCML